MCDRRNMHDKLIERAIDDLKCDALRRSLVKESFVPSQYRREADMIELTAGMIIEGESFGTNLCNRPTSHELGQALVRANKLGLRLIKGSKK